jgi:hypothetical protein
VDHDVEDAAGRRVGVERPRVAVVGGDDGPCRLGAAVRTVAGVGLVWVEQVAPGRLWQGADAAGVVYATVQSSTEGGYRAYVNPRGCDEPQGRWLEGRWLSAEDAQDAADRVVVAHVDSPEQPQAGQGQS